MKRMFLLSALLVFFLMPFYEARGAWEAGVSISEEGVTGFHLSIGEYYNISVAEVEIVSRRSVSDEELSVVFFLASRAGVSNAKIIDLRLKGLSWMEITIRLGLGADIYYVPVKRVKGPPYGKAYGFYKNKPKSEWSSITLTDVEVVDFVNLRFVSEHYGITPEEVIEMRASGKSFVGINDEVKKRGKASPVKGGEGKGKGKGKKK